MIRSCTTTKMGVHTDLGVSIHGISRKTFELCENSLSPLRRIIHLPHAQRFLVRWTVHDRERESGSWRMRRIRTDFFRDAEASTGGCELSSLEVDSSLDDPWRSAASVRIHFSPSVANRPSIHRIRSPRTRSNSHALASSQRFGRMVKSRFTPTGATHADFADCRFVDWCILPHCTCRRAR